jgi:hypothetical protein
MHDVMLAGSGEKVNPVRVKMSIIAKIAGEREKGSLLVLNLLLNQLGDCCLGTSVPEGDCSGSSWS